MTFIRPSIAENAVIRIQHATGNYQPLTNEQRHQIDQLITECRKGHLSRTDIAVRLEHIAGVDR